jgi:hypothetical protein
MDVVAVIQPALDAYGEALSAHRHSGYGEPVACTCGWTSQRLSRTPRRAVGLHISAAHKRASKACDEASAQLMEEASKLERARW